MEVHKNQFLECFLCWKPLKNNKVTTDNSDGHVIFFQFSKLQTENCQKYLKTEILSKCSKSNCDVDKWDCEQFCSSCFETSETLTVLVDIIEETQKELNSVVDLFNKQILNDRCKKLNSVLSTDDSDTGNFSDGFGEVDSIYEDDSEVHNELPPSLSKTENNVSISKNCKKRSSRSFVNEETNEFVPPRSKKRKLEQNQNESANPEKTTNKSSKTIPRIILEKMSDGVVEIMQAKLIERLVEDGIISNLEMESLLVNSMQHPTSPQVAANKNSHLSKSQNDLRDENELYIVNPVVNDLLNCSSIEIKQELVCNLPCDDLDGESSQNHLGSETDMERIVPSDVTNCENESSSSNLLPLDNPVANPVVETSAEMGTNIELADKISNTLILETKTNEKEKSHKTTNYKCEICEFQAVSFEKLFTHKKTHDPDQPLKCTVCSKEFDKELSFFKHMRCHNNTSSVALAHLQKGNGNPNKIRRKSYSCSLCEKKLHSVWLLQKHKEAEHPPLTNNEETSQDDCEITEKDDLPKSSLTLGNKKLIKRKPFKCEICKMRYSTAAKLVLHQINHKISKLDVPRFQCNHEISKSDVPKFQCNHKISKSDVPRFQCKICGNIYSYERGLKRHMRFHTGITPFKCEYCGVCFQDGHALVFHRREHISTFDFICDHENCSEKFRIVQELNAHKRQHKKQNFLLQNDKGNHYQCPECDETFKKDCDKAFVAHMLSHELKFTCSICEKKFTTKIAMDKHHVEEHNNRYPCKLCSQTFKHKSGATMHMKSVHAESSLYVCEECGAGFTLISKFKDHQKDMHPTEDQKTLHCDKCEKTFFTQSKLQRHRAKTHNPQECPVCGMTVKNLKKHLLSHNEVPFVCDVCGKQFKQKRALSLHQRAIHDGQKRECKECGKKFNSVNGFVLHMRTHTGEKPYKCEQCDKRFDRKHNLTTHMRMHTGEKPYKCEKCAKQFSRKDNLNTHAKNCT